MNNIPIGEVLIEYGYLSREKLEAALRFQAEHPGMRLGNILVEQGYVTEYQMLEALSQRLDSRIINLSVTQVDMDAVEKLPRVLARKYRMLPFCILHHHIHIATDDPLNVEAIEDVRQITRLEPQIFLSERQPLLNAIEYYYSEADARAAAQIANQAGEQTIEEIEITDAEDDAPIIQLVNSLISRAYATGASDIHIEPFETQTTVRMRIDGQLVDYVTLKRSIHRAVTTRIKILADMDIAEKRLPQDGHFKIRLENEQVNIRASVIPTVFGEKAVLRLLAGNVVISRHETFGMQEENYRKFMQMLKMPYGIIYLTGPTGSGKTTTLYMVLEYLAQKNINICTIEDPVEKQIARANQMQVNQTSGLTFETGLRALLRQDPDVMMVGETRDTQTAEISVRAAITGHQVFSTLHTNSAVDSIVRMEDMGVEPYLIASSLTGVVAQRLVRLVCPNCAETTETSERQKEIFGKECRYIRHGNGCNQCHFTGYRGRRAIHEVLVVDKEIKEMIAKKCDISIIYEYALQKQGMITLKEEAAALVREGLTSMEEYERIIG